MMKMVAASRLVTDASLEPPSSDFIRTRVPAGEAVADWLSITATGGIVLGMPLEACGHRPIYQRIVKIRSPRRSGARATRANPEPRDSGSGTYAPSRNDASRQFKLTLNSY